eukprot:CAMPEP_0182905022 /NCGR_PEP_ID=MMETSP0034_2-20130328/32586_1 /TAXON_ID=156128 /ORGANISM="Nephroselmis pyriformis, Strain CCMP717" /LENGTH=344 /DNA_ID=CAMNT_0025040323 /DNA_START=122 /DNA_END=1156 /DNA_ORIENTATION=+
MALVGELSDFRNDRAVSQMMESTAIGTQVPLVCHGHSRPIVEVNYSPVTPDGYFLVSASKDGKPMLRNGETGDWIGTFEGHKGAVWSVCLDTPAMHCATGSADFTARIWDALSGNEMHQFQHKHIVRTCSFSYDSRRLVTGGMEKLVRIFDLGKPAAEPLVMEGAMASGIRCAVWHQNDSLLVTSCSDTPGMWVWDVRTAKVVRTLETDASVTSIEVGEGGTGGILTSVDGNQVRFWDATSFAPIKSVKMDRPVESASMSGTTGRFAVGGADMGVWLFDYETGKPVECNKGHHGPVHSVRFAPDGESYASGSEDGTIRIWLTDEARKKAAAEGDVAQPAPPPGA